MKLLCLAYCVVAFFASLVLCADGGYATSCVVTDLWKGKNNDEPLQLISDCAGALGTQSSDGWMCTKINLNMCYTNFHGELRPQLGGFFENTCRDCTLAGTIMSCYCAERPAQPSKDYKHSSIDTNILISDLNSLLACFVHTGSWCGDVNDNKNVTDATLTAGRTTTFHA